MTSRELKNDKQNFINNINQFVEEYNEALKRIKTINSTFTNCEDTLLRNEMLSYNEKLANNLTTVINKVLREKGEVINKIDREIRRLEREEEELLRKKEE